MTSRKREADAFEAALRGAPADPAVTEMVRHAEALCARAATVAPADDFRQALRERLMAEAPELLVAQARPAVAPTRTLGVRRRVARLSAAAIVAVGGIGIVASSAQAVPGDMLYGVKRSVESVELALHRSDVSRGQFQLEQARERLAEAEHLADEGELDRAASALADFRTQAGAGTADLFTHYEADGETATVESVNDFAADSASTLTELAPQFPGSSADPVELAMDAVRDIATQASSLCLECSPVTLPELQASASPTPESDASTTPQAGPSQAITTAPSGSATRSPSTKPSPSPSLAAPVTPAPSSTPSTPAQIPVVTPLVETLLGDDGLVPSLLGGLLGRK